MSAIDSIWPDLKGEQDEIEEGEYISTTPPISAHQEVDGLRTPNKEQLSGNNSSAICARDPKTQSGEIKNDKIVSGGYKMFVNSIKKPLLTSQGICPVFGKEKAKQRLKAMGNQKKMQMNSKEFVTTPKKFGAFKREKKPTPYEKAQRTIHEIEELKRNEVPEERIVPCIYFDASMIHHIRPDNADKIVEFNPDIMATSSLAAIKHYKDDEDDKEEQKSSLSVQLDPATPNSRKNIRFGSIDRLADRLPSPPPSLDRPEKEIRGKKQKGKKNRSNDKRKRSSSLPDRYKLDKERKQRAPKSFIGCENRKQKRVQYTKTFPPIAFTFHPLIYVKGSKRRKGSKKQNEDHMNQSRNQEFKKRHREAHNLSPVKSENINKTVDLYSHDFKYNYPEERSEENWDTPEKVDNEENCETQLEIGNENIKKKSKKLKKEKKQQLEASNSLKGLPVSVIAEDEEDEEEMKFDEELEIFPLAKDSMQEEQIEVQHNNLHSDLLPKIEESIPIPTVTENPDKSPDTDDYVDTWENDDSISVGANKDLPSDVATPEETVDEDSVLELQKIVDRNPSASDDEKQDESDSEAIKDGFCTPIFVNPSPPEHVVNESLTAEETVTGRTDIVSLSRRSVASLQRTPKLAQENEKLLTKSNLPAGIQDAYEQFLQSVKNDAETNVALTQTPVNISVLKEEDFETLPLTAFTAADLPLKRDVADDDDRNSGEVRKCSLSSSSSQSSSAASSTSSSSESSSSSCASEAIDEDDDKTKSSDSDDGECLIADSIGLDTLSVEDLKKLKAMRKRRKMMKNLLKQNLVMDDEDKQCLLKLETLIKAEERLIMRNEKLKHFGKKIIGESCDEDSNCANDQAVQENTSIVNELLNAKPLDNSREAIKLTISPTKLSLRNSNICSMEPDNDDEDFTEKLKIAKEKRSQRIPANENQSERRHRSSLPSSPSSESGGRSLNSKRRIRSPVVKGYRRAADRPKSTSRERKSERKSVSREKDSRNFSSRRSRSPYLGRRVAERSPTNRVARRSYSQERRSLSRSWSPVYRTNPVINNYYAIEKIPDEYSNSLFQASATTDQNLENSTQSWDSQQSREFYSAPHYTYLPSPGRTPLDDRIDVALSSVTHPPRGYVGHFNFTTYTDYNMYTNEYMAPHPTYTENITFSNLTTVIDPANNYVYNEKKNNESPENISISSTVVLKGNVLEIIPVPMPIEKSPEPKKASESISLEEKKRKRKAKRAKKTRTWKEEVDKRHIMSAVLRLNKETGSPKGILINKTPGCKPKSEKKKVLFADGIPPGKASGSEEEEIASLNAHSKRPKKKKLRKEDNKENECLAERDIDLASKIDPDLIDAPPPPPPNGSPPAHLLQPILIAPPEPEVLLYFHFDAVVNSMYVSQIETPVPPRLLNPNTSLTGQTQNAAKNSSGKFSKENAADTVPNSDPRQIKTIPPSCENLSANKIAMADVAKQVSTISSPIQSSIISSSTSQPGSNITSVVQNMSSSTHNLIRSALTKINPQQFSIRPPNCAAPPGFASPMLNASQGVFQGSFPAAFAPSEASTYSCVNQNLSAPSQAPQIYLPSFSSSGNSPSSSSFKMGIQSIGFSGANTAGSPIPTFIGNGNAPGGKHVQQTPAPTYNITTIMRNRPSFNQNSPQVQPSRTLFRPTNTPRSYKQPVLVHPFTVQSPIHQYPIQHPMSFIPVVAHMAQHPPPLPQQQYHQPPPPQNYTTENILPPSHSGVHQFLRQEGVDTQLSASPSTQAQPSVASLPIIFSPLISRDEKPSE